jgi:CheY-like chemotaxis protein
MTTLLIVEDHQPLREILSELFQDDGFRVIVATTGIQALCLLEREEPDLILADVVMPVMDGIDLCQHLKQGKETSDIPIILMTAAGSQLSAEAEQAADGFITKPFDITTMEKLVLHFVGSEFVNARYLRLAQNRTSHARSG